MRPLVAHIVFSLGIGGLENGLVNLINQTGSRLRHAIICLTASSGLEARIIGPDVEVVELHKRPGHDLRMYLRLWSALRRLRPDVVHTRNFGTLDCQLVARLAGVRARVHGFHGWDVGDLDGQSRRRLLICSMSRHVVTRYVAVSEHIRRWLAHDVGLPPDRIVRIANGVDAARFVGHAGASRSALPEHIAKGGTVFGFVGRLEDVKGLPVLLEAFDMLGNSAGANCQSARLVIVGDGSLRRRLEEQAVTSGIDPACWFAGFRDDIPELMRSFDVFVLPSLNEGMSNTALEAMATGLPVIATDVGGNPELVENGRTGLLVPPSDPGSLACAMAKYLDETGLAESHGARGREVASTSLGLQRMVEDYLRLYAEILGPRSQSPCAA